MSGPGDFRARPPWWHEDLVKRVEAMDKRQRQSLTQIHDLVNETRDEINQLHGMRRMLGGVFAFLTVMALITPIIIAIFHH